MTLKMIRGFKNNDETLKQFEMFSYIKKAEGDI